MRLVQPNYSAYYNISVCYTKFFVTPFSLVKGDWTQNVGIILHVSVFSDAPYFITNTSSKGKAPSCFFPMVNLMDILVLFM